MKMSRCAASQQRLFRLPAHLLEQICSRNCMDLNSRAVHRYLRAGGLTPGRSLMSWSFQYHSNRPIWPPKIPVLASILLLMAGCGSDKTAERGVSALAATAVPVVVAPVVQKTIPLFTELTA